MAQTTEWTYLSGSGNGLSIKITEVDNKIKMVHFSQKNGQDWINMQILKINGKADYIRVKSPATDKVYELAVFWYEEKIIRTIFNDTKLIYWLKK